MNSKKYSLLFIVFLSFLLSCKKKIQEMSWDTQNLIPIAKTSLQLNNLLKEDSSLIINNDESISFYHQELLDTLRPLDSLVTLEVAPFYKTVTISSLELSSQKISQQIELGTMIKNAGYDALFQDGATIGSGFVDILGNNIPDLAPIPIDVSSFFKTAVLLEGTIKINVDNQLPFDLTQMDILIKNTQGGETIYQKTLTNIDSKTSFTQEDDLAQLLNGQAIEGELTVFVSNIKAKSSSNNSIILNYADYIEISFELTNLKVESATAVFPEQDIVNHSDEVPLIGDNDFELTFAKIKKGNVYVKSSSTIQDTVYFWYKIPNAILDGDTFQFYVEIPPSKNGETVTIEKVYPFDGYDFDFKGKDGTKTNTFFNILRGRINQSEEIISLSLLDTISLIIEIEKIVPEYVEGYLGKEKFSTGEQTIPIDLNKFLPKGELNFEKVNTSLVFQNSLGVDGKINIQKMESKNITTNKVNILTPSSNDLIISSGKKTNNNYQTVTSKAMIDNTTDLFNSKPDEITFNFDVEINPDGNNNGFGDYVHSSNELITGIEIEIPLSFTTKNLTLQDTTNFLEEEFLVPNGLNQSILSIVAHNEYPLDANVKVYFTDENFQIIDSLTSAEIIQAGIPNSITNKVEKATTSQIDFTLSKVRLENILTAKKIIFKAVLNTQGSNFQKIYDTYSLNFSIIGNIEYAIKGQSLKQ